MKKFAAVAGLFAIATLTAGPARALEAFKTYDSFSSTQINPALWTSGERNLAIRGGVLNLMQRNWGGTAGDSGLSFSSFNESLANPAAVTALKAKITVSALEVSACASNPAVAQSRARIIGSFFNIGTPTPGSQVGDALAQVRLTRFSNSTDPAGTLRVQGLLSVCTNADCSGTNTLGVVELGTVTLGQSTVVQFQWDQPAKTFLFSRDGGASSGSVPYTQDDSTPPSQAFKQVSTRLDIPNCLSGPRVAGSVDAAFDNIAVNRSAAP